MNGSAVQINGICTSIAGAPYQELLALRLPPRPLCATAPADAPTRKDAPSKETSTPPSRSPIPVTPFPIPAPSKRDSDCPEPKCPKCPTS